MPVTPPSIPLTYNIYSYETFGYILEDAHADIDPEQVKYHWEILTDKEKNQLIESHLDVNRRTSIKYVNDAVKPFLEDFEHQKLESGSGRNG
ncbi:hypothetical protein DSCA_60630 [Desulfosarcina alkanivorans]|uniref:Uncharacterized protein n=1 Tax=Desulfosarcina alkanivorans TaxID=571177 RepID=A0A5K7YVV3_9BACT|nr:hypothetical protein DSCA_60630 [Desulfosarcina alkanivorans]